MNNLKGVGVALVTPFKEDLSVDFESLTKLVEFNIENGGNPSGEVYGTNKETVIDDYKELFDIIRSRKMEWEMESDGAYTKITFKTSLCCTLSDY